MKNRLFKTIALAMLLALAVSMLPAMAATVKPKLVKETLYAGTGETWLSIKNWDYGTMEIVSVKSDNPKVLKVVESTSREVIPLKAGKAKITLKYKINGKKYTTSSGFTVEKYPKAIKSLTFNGKGVNLKDSNNMLGYEYLDFDRTKFKINLKPASGWSIYKLKAYTSEYEDGRNPKSFSVKNNKQFKVSRDDCGFVVYTLKNKKGVKFEYIIRILRVGE